jgi:hypothetical protein
VTPWSPHDGARHARLRAGPGHTRMSEREDPYLQSASGSPSRAACWMRRSLKTKKPKRTRGSFGGFRTPVAHGGSVHGGGEPRGLLTIRRLPSRPCLGGANAACPRKVKIQHRSTAPVFLPVKRSWDNLKTSILGPRWSDSRVVLCVAHSRASPV